MRPEEIELVKAALAEDVGDGDLTTLYFTNPTRNGAARIVAREACTLAGMEMALETFRQVDPDVRVIRSEPDGAVLAPGDSALDVSGSVASLLTAERTALNFLQRLSGVATLTAAYVEAVRGTAAKILDTRKTTPGWRLLEKQAVKAGGGTNHRIGLYDMVMVKDNHLAAGTTLETLQSSILKVKAEHPGTRVELEVDTLDQLRDFLTLDGVDVILLDNMSPAIMREAIAMRKNNVLFEASGGVNLDTVRAIAETGVDFISVGALTHSARSVDLSMEITG